MSAARKDFQIFAKPIGWHCNLRCRYCYYLGTRQVFSAAQPPAMSDALLRRYIEHHLLAHPGEVVRFSWHGGEPTLLGLDFFERVVQLQGRLCPRGKTVANGIQTNGTLIDEAWAAFLARHHFTVGLSLDGPQPLHDRYRCGPGGEGSFARALAGYQQLRRHGVAVEALCVVNDENVMYPLQVYEFFREIDVRAVSFLPLVERGAEGVGGASVEPEAFGAFLCTIFDRWLAQDIGRIAVQIFEEALRTAFGEEHALCLFRPTCGDIPTVEHNGDVFPCDHYVRKEYLLGNIAGTPLLEILRSPRVAAFGNDKRRTLPMACGTCQVLDMCAGECPRNRFVDLPGETMKGNYLCAGYKMFFTHCRPFVDEVARQWRSRPR